MEIKSSNKNYLLLKNWWENLDLTNYEKSLFNKEIISFNQQLLRLKEKKIRVGVFGRAGVGKSSILNLLFNKKVFRTNIIHGSTKKVEGGKWDIAHKTLKNIELLDSPGFDFCNTNTSVNMYSKINYSELILFVVAGDLNRNEVDRINSFLDNGKKIIIILNKIDIWDDDELKGILKNIKSKLPKESHIPIIKNSGSNIKNYVINTLDRYGETFLILNTLQMADQLFLRIKKQRLQKRQKEAQSIISKFATIKASGVALNPLILFDLAGGFALDSALISELSKVYGFNLEGKSVRKIVKKISFNNLCLGATQVGINTSFNLIRKVILLTVPFTNGLSLLPYGPIAIIQAAIAVKSTKYIGKLATKELFNINKVCNLEPFFAIQKIILTDPKIFNHINIYLSNRNLKNNYSIFLP